MDWTLIGPDPSPNPPPYVPSNPKPGCLFLREKHEVLDWTPIGTNLNPLRTAPTIEAFGGVAPSHRSDTGHVRNRHRHASHPFTGKYGPTRVDADPTGSATNSATFHTSPVTRRSEANGVALDAYGPKR